MLCEHCAARMLKIQGYMNSPAFVGKVCGGLEALAADLRPRCQQVVQLKGQRIPKGIRRLLFASAPMPP